MLVNKISKFINILWKLLQEKEYSLFFQRASLVYKFKSRLKKQKTLKFQQKIKQAVKTGIYIDDIPEIVVYFENAAIPILHFSMNSRSFKFILQVNFIPSLSKQKGVNVVIDLDNNPINQNLNYKYIDFLLTNRPQAYRNSISYEKLFFVDNTNLDYYFNRFLLSIDIIDFKHFYQQTLSFNPFVFSNHILLTLPECHERYQYATCLLDSSELAELKFNAFSGLRHSIPWIGCGLSYKYLFLKAQQFNQSYILIAEDDISLNDKFVENFKILKTYLTENSDWDIYNGYTYLKAQQKMQKSYALSNCNLYQTDNFISMLFNAYSKRCLAQISQWQPYSLNLNNTIDEFICAEKLKIVITIPFLIEHNEMLDSVLWQQSNKFQYHDYIRASKENLNSLKIID